MCAEVRCEQDPRRGCLCEEVRLEHGRAMSFSDPGWTSAVCLQARMAGERGASAVLFDITEDRAAAEQVPRDIGVFEEGAGRRKIK